MTITRMALIVVTCVTAGVAIDVARDGGGPPREGTRAEASPFVAPDAATTAVS